MQEFKKDEGKNRWDLLPLAQVDEVVKVITYATTQYPINSWKRLPDFNERFYAAVMRHLVSWRGGEFNDKESGLPHLAHAACGLLYLLHGEANDGECTAQQESNERSEPAVDAVVCPHGVPQITQHGKLGSGFALF